MPLCDKSDDGVLTELPQGTQDTSLPLLLSEPPLSALWASGTPMVGCHWAEWLKGVSSLTVAPPLTRQVIEPRCRERGNVPGMFSELFGP